MSHFNVVPFSLLAVAVVCCFAAAERRAEPVNDEARERRWDVYARMADLIGRMPEWPETGQWTAEEETRAFVIAAGMQGESFDDLQRALLAYMMTTRHSVDVIPPVAEAKAMLLLRVIYDVPADATLKERTSFPCGAMNSKPPWQDDQDVASIGEPLSWNAEGSSRFIRHYARGGGTGPGYCPLVESQYFEDSFQRRQLRLPPGLTVQGLLDAELWLDKQDAPGDQ